MVEVEDDLYNRWYVLISMLIRDYPDLYRFMCKEVGCDE